MQSGNEALECFVPSGVTRLVTDVFSVHPSNQADHLRSSFLFMFPLMCAWTTKRVAIPRVGKS